MSRQLQCVERVPRTAVDQVAGDLFLNPATDWAYEWVRQNLFVQLTQANRIVPVKLAWRGLKMGQCRP
jgi:hypothetical protein